MALPARTAATRQPAVATGPLCPRHHLRLDGGPVWFHCPAGHGLPAADINHEFGEEVEAEAAR
jgi:hypothetical protein